MCRQVFEFNLLGPFEVVVDGAAVPLGGPRQQAVLALLLLESGHPLSAERMLDTVWDGRPPASAASTLYAYIARLRKALGSAGGALQRVSGGYVLDVPAGAGRRLAVRRGRRSSARPDRDGDGQPGRAIPG